MQLRRPLGRQQQPQAVLATLPCDLDEAFDERLLDRARPARRGRRCGPRRPRSGSASGSGAAPRGSRSCRGSARGLGRVGETAEVQDRDPGPVATISAAEASAPANTSQSVRPRFSIRCASARPASSPARNRARRPSRSAGRVAAELLQEQVVLLTVLERVEPQHRGLGPPRHGGEPHPQRLEPRGRGPQHPDLLRRQPRRVLGRRIRQRLPQPDEVGVRVEHHHPQVGAEQQLLEDHAERVGLARTALAAQERVPPEALGPQPGRHLDAAVVQVPIGRSAPAEPCRAPSSRGTDRLDRRGAVRLARRHPARRPVVVQHGHEQARAGRGRAGRPGRRAPAVAGRPGRPGGTARRGASKEKVRPSPELAVITESVTRPPSRTQRGTGITRIG